MLVLDSQGHSVTGLGKDDFIVKEDGQPQPISQVSLGDDQGVERSIVLILDYSDSQFPYLDTSVEAARLLIDKLGPKDRMAIVTDDVKLLVDFTHNKTDLKTGLDSLKRRWQQRTGKSAQFSALLA